MRTLSIVIEDRDGEGMLKDYQKFELMTDQAEDVCLHKLVEGIHDTETRMEALLDFAAYHYPDAFKTPAIA